MELVYKKKIFIHDDVLWRMNKKGRLQVWLIKESKKEEDHDDWWVFDLWIKGFF
jgi:hypothetical protein